MAKPTIVVHDQFNPPGHPGTANDQPSLTQQQYAEECDINFIMRNYTQQGLIPQGTTKTAVYGDFSDVTDYFEALRIIHQAEDQFNELPAQVRARFQNDPAELLAFIENRDNLEEARKLGMLKDEPPAPPKPATNEGTVPSTAPAPAPK